MKTLNLGSQGMIVSQMGYGCMGLTTAYGKKLPDDDIVKMLEKVAEVGVTTWDTANIYAFPDWTRLLTLRSPIVCQEEIIAKALKKVGRENIQICTKTGNELYVFPKLSIVPNGQPSFIRQQCEDSLRRLQVDTLDLFYLHRIDQTLPIEVTMHEMKKLVEEGKVKYVGLSECSPATIRRAHAVHPLTAVQMEYSLWSRSVEAEVFPTCAELGIGVVAYSPLGRGFFGGVTKGGAAGLGRGDYRATQERFTGETGKRNEEMLAKVEEIAQRKGVTTAQLALAWVEAQQFRLKGAGLIAIPGTTKEKNLLSNVASLDVQLSPEDIAALEAAVDCEKVEGDRYEGGSGHTFEADKNPPLTPELAGKYGISQN